jgi:hypothetical protein
MPNHKFRIGQMVTYRPAERGQDAPPGACMITARLPESEETGEFEYRIRNLERQTHMNDESRKEYFAASELFFEIQGLYAPFCMASQCLNAVSTASKCPCSL